MRVNGCARLAALVALLGGCASAVYDRGHDVSRVVAPAGSARKVCQLTGETDNGFPTPVPVQSHTDQRAHLLGTDLGASFTGPAPGTVHFLFGDTAARIPGRHALDDDAVAVTRADADPERCLDLAFYTDPAGEYVPVKLTGFSLGSFEVPTGAFVVNGATFATFATDATGTPPRPTRSVLAVAEHFPEQLTFSYLADLPPSKLLNVSAILVEDSGRPGPHPTKVLFFGTGPYRSSKNVYLAVFPLADLRSAARAWFVARGPSGDALWSDAEDEAHPIFDRDGAPCMGEISVAWNPYLEKWLMLYNCDQPRGILYRVAPAPWGPWTEPRVLFDPRADGGYCEFIHDRQPAEHCAPGSPNPQDALIARGGGPDAYGGEYGPYMIEAFTRGNTQDKTTTVYFTMSTWNPYEVVLMRATLREGLEQSSTRKRR
jgi:Domain of unknown function (DUF4185)